VIVLTHHNSYQSQDAASRGLRRLKSYILGFAIPLTYRYADAVVAVSNGIAEDVASIARMKSEDVRVIWNPAAIADPPEKPIKNADPGSQRCRILFLGRLLPQKRVDLLIRAMALLSVSHRVELVIAGDGPESGSLGRLADELQISEYVVFVGNVASPAEWIVSSDVLALPSDYEGLSNVLVEALSCGVQVVSTDCPHGPREVLDNGRFGQLVPVGDYEAMATAIANVLDGIWYVAPEDLRMRAQSFQLAGVADKYLELLGLERFTSREWNSADVSR